MSDNKITVLAVLLCVAIPTGLFYLYNLMTGSWGMTRMNAMRDLIDIVLIFNVITLSYRIDRK